MGAKRRRESKKLKTYLKKIITENFPNLVKEIDIQVLEAQRVPNKMNPRRPTLRHIIIKMLKVKDERENLKSSKRIAVSYLQGSSHKTCQLISQKKLCRLEGIDKKYSKS